MIQYSQWIQFAKNKGNSQIEVKKGAIDKQERESGAQ